MKILGTALYCWSGLLVWCCCSRSNRGSVVARSTTDQQQQQQRQRPSDSKQRQQRQRGIMSIGPVELWNSTLSCSFSWQARVDRTTALASAREITRKFPCPTTAPTKDSIISGPALFFWSKQLFTNYPEWLCRGWVTLGLLRAVPVAEDEDAVVEIQDRFLGLSLLRFGRPYGTRISKHTSNKDSKATMTMTDCCVWSLPITGGILSAADHSKHHPSGRLVFMFTTTTSSSSQAGGVVVEPQCCSLQTEVVEYRPLLVGSGALPANIFRTGLYLSSQSLIHAMVMWRFHRYCRRKTRESGCIDMDQS